tara:strand:- start:12575 stop:13771 length:1197 start_codon:yes stop_codon:yes gene_type:complete
MQINKPSLFVEINHSEYIFTVSGYDKNEKFNIFYQKKIPIEGIEKKKITDHNLVNKVLKNNIYAIEQKLDFIFNKAILILDNLDCNLINLVGYKRLNGSQLVKENLSYILSSLKSKINEHEKQKTVIHIFNSNYFLDNKRIENLPIGLFGEFYSHELSFFLIDNNDYKNINNIFKSCNLRIKRIISKDFLRGVSLIKENLELQTFFEIQISKNRIHLLYFENSTLKFIQDFEFGSHLVYNDISKVTSLKNETLDKILSELDFSNEKSLDELIEKKYFIDQNYRKIKKKLILEIADSRIQELAELVILKNINVKNFIKKNISIFLQIDNVRSFHNFKARYKIAFSNLNSNNVKFIEENSHNNFYKNAFNIVHFGWSKEALPVIQEKKSIISRLFDLIFK